MIFFVFSDLISVKGKSRLEASKSCIINVGVLIRAASKLQCISLTNKGFSSEMISSNVIIIEFINLFAHSNFVCSAYCNMFDLQIYARNEIMCNIVRVYRTRFIACGSTTVKRS